MLQGTFADIKQLAHITIVQPISVPALFSKCLVAGRGKTEYLVPQLCPIWIRNDKISHSSIIVLFVIPFLFCASSHVSACKSTECLPYFKARENSREIQGKIRKGDFNFSFFLCLLTPSYHIRFSKCNTMRIVANKHLPFLYPLCTCPLVWSLNPCFPIV